MRRRVTIYTSMVCETSPDTVGFTGGSIPLYTVVTGTASVTSYTDNRTWVAPGYLPSNGSIMVTAADVDLTAAVNADKARCSYLTTTGALTANRNVIVPNSWQAVVYCNNSGGVHHDVQDGSRKRRRGGAGQACSAARRRHQRRLRDAEQLMGATKVREGDRRTCSSVQSHPQFESTTGHRSFILFI